MMPSPRKISVPARLVEELEPPLKRAPTLYVIIFFKLIKGVLFSALAVAMFWESTHDLSREYRAFLNGPFVQTLFLHLKIHPENRFFTHLAEQIGDLTQAKVRWAAVGTLVWSLFPLVEGIGLVYRVGWAGWLAIGESAFFVPIELYELARKFSWYLTGVMIINVFIVCYLYRFRAVLFHHHRHHRLPPASEAPSASF